MHGTAVACQNDEDAVISELFILPPDAVVTCVLTWTMLK